MQTNSFSKIMGIQIIGRKDFEKKPHPSDRKSAKNIRIKKNKIGNKTADLRFFAKPWGFECLRLRNRHFDIWELFINPQSSTSSHIHVKKDALMLVIKGDVILATTGQKNNLSIGDFRIFKRGTVHQIINATDKIAHILEIESPPNRDDLLRIHDSYGREGLPYLFCRDKSAQKKSTPVSKCFFQEAQKENDFFGFFKLIPSSKKQKRLQVFGIACQKEVSSKDTESLNLLRRQITKSLMHSFLVIQGTISIKERRKITKIRKRGDCFILPDSSEIIRLSRNAIFIGWK